MPDDAVLVVEDSSVVSDLVRDLLEAASFSVVQASTSKDGLALVKEGQYQAIIVDAQMPKVDGYQILKQVRAKPSALTTPVLILTEVSGEAPSDLPPGSGPIDFVRKPIDPVDLIVRVRAAVGGDTTAPKTTLAGKPSGGTLKPSESPDPGTIVTIFSLKGGVGTSTLAVNVAVALRKLWNESTGLVDLSLESGALNILLDIMPTSTLDELVAENGNMTAELVSQFLVAHKSGVSLLSAPPSPERAELVEGAGLRKALTFLRTSFDYLVIDTASTFAEHTLMALEMADHIILPIIGDISSVRATTTALDILQVLSIPDDRIIPVFNNIFPKIGLSRKHAEHSLQLSTRDIPFGGAKLLDSVNLGTPIVMSDPDSPVSQAIEDLAFDVSRDSFRTTVQAKQSELLTKVRKRVKVA